MSELRFEKVEEYIFAPFNTFVYIDEDQLRLTGMTSVVQDLLEHLNQNPPQTGFEDCFIKWDLEDSEAFKLSKGVFAAPGTDNSFVMARIVNAKSEDTPIPLPKEMAEELNLSPLTYSNVRFYFQDCGVGTLSVRINIEKIEGLTILELEQVSEAVNNLIKEYFENLCFQLTDRYIQAIRKLDVPRHSFAYIPEIEDIERSKHFIPWTHRLYHIPDDSMFELENPGEPFKVLLTPSRQMDIKDLSIYDNRWIYFGWGHSIIFTHSEEDGYSQTSRPVDDYVRLVEIAQANWQFLDVLKDIITYAIASFNYLYETLSIEDLKESIDELRSFKNGMDQILSLYRGVKITFDTEKRVLLDELHKRWLTENMLENLLSDLQRIEDLLDQLYQRQKEQREESLNTIALLFTIVGIIEIIALFIDIVSPDIDFPPFAQVLLIILGTIVMAVLISLYLRIAGRR
ncbi:MAG: hypothetical protein ACW98Y_00360 [Candidatus Thorarchaeota archaeon]